MVIHEIHLNFLNTLEPLNLDGDGNYPLTSVKEVKTSDGFLGLDQKFTKCQTKESLEDCKTKIYLEKLREVCHCVPYELKNATDDIICNSEGLRCSNDIMADIDKIAESCAAPCEGIYVEVKRQPAANVSANDYSIITYDYEQYKAFFEGSPGTVEVFKAFKFSRFV